MRKNNKIISKYHKVVNSELFLNPNVCLNIGKSEFCLFTTWRQSDAYRISDTAHFTYSKNLDNMMEKLQEPPD